MNRATSCSLITDLEGPEASFPCLVHRGRYMIYIKSIAWHCNFIILATILEPKKCCRKYVEAGAKWPKCPKLSSKAKNGCT